MLCVTVFERDQFSPDGAFTLTPLPVIQEFCCNFAITVIADIVFSFVSPSTFSPSEMSLHISDFLGRTEIRLAEIKKDQGSKGPITKRLLLHEVPTGEIVVRLDLQLFEEP